MNHATWDFHFRDLTFHSSSKQTLVFQMTSFKVLRIMHVLTQTIPHLTKFVFDIILLVCIYIWNIY